MTDPFTDVFATSPVGIVALDLQNVIRAWNPAAARLFGFSARDAIGKTPEQLDLVPRRDCEIARNGAEPMQQREALCRRRDGTSFLAELCFVWVLSEERRPIGTHVFVRDVTEHRLADAKLKDAETRYQRVVDGAEQFALFSMDPHGRIDTWNLGAERVFGYNEAEILGKHTDIIFTDEDRQNKVSAQEMELAKEHGNARDERWHVRKDGSRFWANGALTALREDDGSLTGFVKALRDDTRRKLAEERLEEEKERLEIILESLAQGVVVTDAHGTVTRMNAQAEAITGWSRTEGVGQALAAVLPIGLINGQDPVAAARTNGRRERADHRVELKTKRGEGRPVAFIDMPVRHGGEFMGAVFVFRDIAEEIKMEESMLKAEKLSALGVLSAGIAHQFNNLLTGLFGNITLARLSLQPEDPAFQPLNDAESVFWRARELTQRFLTFAKGGEPMKKRGFVQGLLAESAQLVLAGRNIRLDFDIPDDLWPVEFDEDQIRQALTSVLLNAKEATEDGGRIEIGARNVTLGDERVGALPTGPYVEVVIRDTGRGIASEVIAKVFDPFFTTKPGSTGLGLSTAHSIVVRHRGAMTLDSEPGRGTAVRIFLRAAITSP